MCTSRGHQQRHKSPCYSQPVPLHITSPSCGLSRAKFLNIYLGVLKVFPRGSVWTLALSVDGSRLVLELARAKLIPEIEWRHVPKPVLLLIDGEKVHISLFISKLCDENNIILIHTCQTPHICCRHSTLNWWDWWRQCTDRKSQNGYPIISRNHMTNWHLWNFSE